jgi:SPP1 family predicted phage head-tail adaptor
MQTQIGQLNRKISFLTQSSSQDAFGAPVGSWTPTYTCWANIDVQRSQLLYETAEFINKTVVRITVRWTKTVIFTPAMRISYTEPSSGVTHTYEVEAIMNDNQSNIWVTLLTYELAAQE